MTSKVRGHPLPAKAMQGLAAARCAGLALRRGRHIGRGWPGRVLIEGSLKVSGSGRIVLGSEVRLNDGVWLHAEDGAYLSIGARSAVGRGSMITSMGRVQIGDDVLLSPHVVVMDHSHGSPSVEGPYLRQPLVRRGSITIEDGCWLGAHVCILSGTEDLVIGARSLIGAGAVVTRSVPTNSVVHGQPAGPRAHPTAGSRA